MPGLAARSVFASPIGLLRSLCFLICSRARRGNDCWLSNNGWRSQLSVNCCVPFFIMSRANASSCRRLCARSFGDLSPGEAPSSTRQPHCSGVKVAAASAIRPPIEYPNQQGRATLSFLRRVAISAMERSMRYLSCVMGLSEPPCPKRSTVMTL